MNSDPRDIDRLLKANVEGQLADFDWDRLQRRVAGRLAAADLQPRRTGPVVRSLAVAAGILLVAGVATVVFLNLKSPGRVPPPEPGRATVVLAAGTPERTVTRCEIRIHSPAKPAPEKAAKRPSWCIVTVPEPLVTNGAYERELASLACLF